MESLNSVGCGVVSEHGFPYETMVEGHVSMGAKKGVMETWKNISYQPNLSTSIRWRWNYEIRSENAFRSQDETGRYKSTSCTGCYLAEEKATKLITEDKIKSLPFTGAWPVRLD